MPKKKKPSVKTRLFARSGLRAVAVVALVIGLGGIVLPSIFAAESAQPVYGVGNLSVRALSGTSFRFSWSGSTPDHYTVRVGDGTGSGPAVTQTKATETTHSNLRCGTTYTFNVVPSDKNNSFDGNKNRSVTARTANCPTPAPSTPTPAPSTPAPSKPSPAPSTPAPSSPAASSPAKSTPSSSASSSSNRLRATTSTPATTTGGGAVSVESTAAPETPANFTANISSNKVVELSWDAAANGSRYVVTRSTDNTNFTQIADVEETSYSDESADFATKYYYQLTAVGSDGQMSAPVSVEATTEAFEASSNKITSDDKKVTITVPDGAIDGDYSCTLSTDDSSGQAPAGLASIMGPYDLLCVTADGEVVEKYNEPLPVTMKLGASAEGYKDLTVQLSSNNKWTAVKAISYDQNKQTIGFKLASAQSFGVFGVKTKSMAWIFIVIFFVLLLIAAIIFFLIRRRRNKDNNDYSSYTAAPPLPDDGSYSDPNMLPVAAPNTAQEEFRQAVAQPDCSHLEQAQQVLPSSQGCLECEQQGTKWNSLRICLICGHVGCSDDSDQQHALKHFQETGHPLIYEYGNEQGNSIGWCYIDQTYI